MAIVDRSGKVRGAISNLVYRSYRSLNIIQSKPAKVKQTIASKESGLEFGLCSNAACEIRKAFNPAYSGYDGAMINRFTGLVRKGLQACTTKERGYRDMHDADLSFLQGFQFNANSPLDKVLKVRPIASLEENSIRVSLPAFSVRRDIKWLPNALKCTLRIVAISFDFRKKVFSYLGCKEQTLKQTDTYAAQEWLIEEPLPQGVSFYLVCLYTLIQTPILIIRLALILKNGARQRSSEHGISLQMKNKLKSKRITKSRAQYFQARMSLWDT